ncbi:MAG: hypothetical protein ABJB33_03255 [Gemmatimonadota bacterium]
MIRPRALLPLLASAGFVAACAYYNGLYNANDLAHRAEKAERDGRTLDAQSLWGQVAVRAETVVARHPHSKWTDEARLLQGKALERTGDCTAAIGPLQRVMRESGDPHLVDEAAFRLSSCQLKLGDLEAAGYTVERFLQSPDPARRNEAAWRAGIAYRRTGRAEEAVTVLRASRHRQARGELAAALADAGRDAEAIALADSLLAERDTTAPWGAVLSGIGQHDAAAASALLARVLTRLSPLQDTAAAWLTADARRLLPSDEARALAQLEAAYSAAPARAVGLYARIIGLRHRLAMADDPAFLDSIPLILGDIEPSAGDAMIQGRQLAEAAQSARQRLDSLVVTAPQGDIKGFLLGEALRDSLRAPRLAALVWRRVLAERPESPYAPKMLLAIAATGATPDDSITTLLDGRYAGSPYVLALHGHDDPAYRALEDSLVRFARSARTPARTPTIRPPARGARPTPTSPTPATPVQ